MNAEQIDITKVVKLLSRYKGLLFTWILAGTCAGIVLALVLPKQFKSRAVLSIQAGYFQAPMVNEFVSTVNDPRELQAQRLSLLRMALSDEFLERIGERYGIFETNSRGVERARELELFRGKIELFGVSPTSFQISAVGKSPTQARALTLDIMEQMMETVVLERYRALLNSHQAIRAHTEKLEEQLKRSKSPEINKEGAEIKQQLLAAEAKLSELLSRFTEKHPSVIQHRQRLAALRQRALAAEPAAAEQSAAASDLPPIDGIAVAPMRSVFEELRKKLSYLEVVLDMERDYLSAPYLSVVEKPSMPTGAVFPKRRIFAGVGAGLGLICGLFFMILAEFRRASAVSPRVAAVKLGVPLFGELPDMREIAQISLPAPTSSLPASLPANVET